ncbi:hypothetical protein SD436_06920 [Streptococcus sp. 2A/TPW/M5]
MTVTEKKDAYVLYYQTDDVKNMISISRPIFLGGTTAFYGFADTKVKDISRLLFQFLRIVLNPYQSLTPLMAKLQRKPWI